MRVRMQELRLLVTRLLAEGADEGALDTPRLKLTYKILGGRRMVIDAWLKSPDWLEKAQMDVKPDESAVQQTVDFVGDEAYLSSMDALFRGKGYGPEVMTAVLHLLKDRGFKTARGYVEHGNAASQRMMKKVGAVAKDRKEHGSYWVVDLTKAL
jgi:ribosomal protein S18 acetylase RimI-like enzyme